MPMNFRPCAAHASPVVPPALIADIAGGTYPAVLNILLALQERARTGRGRALDIAIFARDRQTAFLADLRTLCLLDFRIDRDNRSITILQVHNEKPTQNANLRGGQTDAIIGVHGFEHIIDQGLQFIIKSGNGAADFAQGIVPVFEYLSESQGGCPPRFGVRVRVWAWVGVRDLTFQDRFVLKSIAQNSKGR